MRLRLLLGLFCLFLSHSASALTISVVDQNGAAVTGFRWLVEEDNTYQVVPGVAAPDTISVRFHQSHAPVVANGNSASAVANIPNTKRYYVSILPDVGFTMGGAPVDVGQNSVVVTVNALPLPTAQISIFVYEDNHPINNEPDFPEEQGLAGFTIMLTESGGRDGEGGGQISQDIFGNPLGTTYKPDGSVDVMGSGIIKTDANGVAHIKNLPQGKFSIAAIPPLGSDWHQTSTVEGTHSDDAWVKNNEPSFFTEFGPPGHHINIGFVHLIKDTGFLKGHNTVSGRAVNLHNSRPPVYTFWPGNPTLKCWVGLNDLSVAGGRGVYVQKCNDDSTFSIPNVPPGNYQLVLWDENLDNIFGLQGFTVIDGQDKNLGDIQVFNWFGRVEGSIFQDRNKNGFRDCTTSNCMDPTVDDIGIPEQVVNLRFRDGSIYQTRTTDPNGNFKFDEVFPFFRWLVAEVDNTRFKPTGATFVVDGGGQVLPDRGWAYPSRGKLTPQPQADINGNPIINPNTGNNLSRTELGEVRSQAFLNFLGQTSVMEFGKSPYAPGENGGITGIVSYDTTRAEDDPVRNVQEQWQPNIPRVTVNLYASDGNGNITNPVPLKTTTTDSWDDSIPKGCQGTPFVSHGLKIDCFDGLPNFNQTRDGVFDGAYHFGNLPAGNYIVEVITPQGYQIVKEEDKNITFGDTYRPSPLTLPTRCVGALHKVPQYLALFPSQKTPAPLGGQMRPLCDRKEITVTDGMNANVNFFMFTEVPKAARIVGIITDDLSNEFDTSAPTFGEKYAPPFMPVSIRDWTGRELQRVYSDEWGTFNAMVYSSFDANPPIPSGYAPNVLVACMNSPGPIKNPAYVPGGTQPQYITDPFFSRNYSQFCYQFQVMPGTTEYLDTPVVPVGAFTGPGQFPVDCESSAGTPELYSVSGPLGGPYLTGNGASQLITIVSEGTISVQNPAYDPALANAKTIQRDFGFGATPGTVRVGSRNLQIVSWDANSITARVPSNGMNSGELVVTRGDNHKATTVGVTVTVGDVSGLHRVQPSAIPGATPIQDAIDQALPGDLILLSPGHYEEYVTMWKPVQLQGWGARSTVIDSVNVPAEKLQAWRDKITGLLNANAIDLLPGQTAGPIDPSNNEPTLFGTEEGATIIVLAKNASQQNGGFGPSPRARIDGFTITGSSIGGGIVVNGYAHYLDVTNNRIWNNSGIYGGGVRIGHPLLANEAGGTLQYTDAQNDHVRIMFNDISENGTMSGVGGGVSLGSGASNYSVNNNFVCGNYAVGDGGGIGHYGLSNHGSIASNVIIFNESFDQSKNTSGGGIMIAGADALTTLSQGSGSVSINGNWIQGNLAGAGDGGGIASRFVNGQDVAAANNSPSKWYSLDIFNNMIVDNVAGLAGGGIGLQDTARSRIINNTIANNDSTGTMMDAFSSGPSRSNQQPAGIVSRAHSPGLLAAFGTSPAVQSLSKFSNPVLMNDIIWHNRSFYWDVTVNNNIGGLLPSSTSPRYWDLEVLGSYTGAKLNPVSCDLTNRTGYSPSNISADPRFVSEYFNGDRGSIIMPDISTGLATSAAFDEGGNFIDVRYGPLSLRNPTTGALFGDYHLKSGSPAIGKGSSTVVPLYRNFVELPEGGDFEAADPALSVDLDGKNRAPGSPVDIGAVQN